MIKLSRVFFVLFILLFTFSTTVYAEFEVPPGGIAIIGFNFDDPDEFSFVCTTNIPAGTEIRFTDNGWTSAGTFRTGEGIISWYTPGGCSIGKIVNIKPSEHVDNTTGIFNLTSDGDQILVYQFLSGATHHIFALNSEGTGWQPTASDAYTSALPTGLDSTNSIALLETDNAVYTGLKTFTSVSEGLSSIVDVDNWDGSDTLRQTMPPITTTFSFGTTAVTVSSFTVQTTNQSFPIIYIAVPLFLLALFFLWKYFFIKAHN